ncbi:MAG: MFS transporter [Myxococcota bacterium]|nr:MFS transporter [Myxococcota bacterium]
MVPFGFAVFFVFGVNLVLVGANQAELARDLSLDLARSGLLGATLALGIGVGVAGSGPLVDRLPRRPLFLASTLLAATGLLLFDASMGFTRALLQVALIGVGVGVQETLVNASVAEVHGARAAKPLLVVHAAATLGAMLAPLIVGWLAEQAHWTASFRATGGAQLALALVGLRVAFPAPPAADAAPHAPLAAVWSPALVPFLVVGFAYVGVETTLTLFAVPYATGALALDADAGRTAISALWLGLLVGRLIVLAIPRRIDARLLAAAGLAGTGVLALGIGTGVESLAAVYGATGVVMGFVFPVMIALAAERFPEARGTATGLVAGAAALGGFAVPWLHGAAGDRVGVAAALLGLAPWCVAVALAALAAWRGAKRPGAA